MRCRVEYSSAAIRDLDRIWTEVFESSMVYDITWNYINDLMNRVEDKSIFPNSGTPLYYKDRFTGYYFIIYKSYLAFYRVENERMLVDRILPARSNYFYHLHLSSE